MSIFVIDSLLAFLLIRKQEALLYELKHQFVWQLAVQNYSDPVILIHMIRREDMVARFGEVVGLAIGILDSRHIQF